MPQVPPPTVSGALSAEAEQSGEEEEEGEGRGGETWKLPLSRSSAQCDSMLAPHAFPASAAIFSFQVLELNTLQLKRME